MSFFDSLEDEVKYHKSTCFYGFTTFEYNVIVCVENRDDEAFWKFLISELKINKIKPVFLHLDGKENIKKFINYLDEEFIGCIDSDYDYILEKEYLSNPYLFHTYVYSIENYCTHADTIHSLLNTLNLNIEFDFVSFFKKMSIMIEDFLYYDIYLKDNSEASIRNIFKFNNLSEEQLTEDTILNVIQNQIESLGIEIEESKIKKYKNKIKNDSNLNQDYLQLYIEGHIIYDSLMALLNKFSEIAYKSKVNEIKSTYSGKKIQQKINELRNQTLDLNTLLKTNYKECYYRNFCNSFNKILDDIKIIAIKFQ